MPDIDLPYNYAPNTRSGGTIYIAISVLVTIALVALFFTGWPLPIPLFVTTIPAFLFAIRVFFFTLIRNAVHEATRMADTDSRLDDIVIDAIDAEKRTGLTPGFLNAKLLGASE